MFDNIKLLKKLKNESYEVEYTLDDYINENNEAIIYVNCKDSSDIISKYSSGEDLTINKELSSYLQDDTNYLNLKYPINIKINSEKELSRDDKDKIKLSIRNHFTKKVSDVNEKLYENKNECIMLVFLSLFFLLAYVFTKIYLPLEILSEILLIISWVFVWRMTESIVFDRKAMRKEAIKYYRLLNARIEFLN